MLTRDVQCLRDKVFKGLELNASETAISTTRISLTSVDMEPQSPREFIRFVTPLKICAVRIVQVEADGVSVRVEERALAMGIAWCVEQGIRIVNVSYSIAEPSHGGCLRGRVGKRHEKGAILVAAYRNGERGPVYPAAFPTVIGVRRRSDLKPGQVVVLDGENLDVYAWGTSNSIAGAQVSAMVGRIDTVDDRYGLEEVFAFLKEVAI